MEDAATAEISRGQIWHWIRSAKGKLDDGRPITKELFLSLVPEELAKIRASLGEDLYSRGDYKKASEMFTELILDDEFVEFLTLPAYQYIASKDSINNK